jgi:hypothetical protein
MLLETLLLLLLWAMLLLLLLGCNVLLQILLQAGRAHRRPGLVTMTHRGAMRPRVT